MMPTAPDLKKLLIVAMVSVLTACGGSDGRKAKYMDEGKQLFAAGDYQKPSFPSRTYCKLTPKTLKHVIKWPKPQASWVKYRMQ